MSKDGQKKILFSTQSQFHTRLWNVHLRFKKTVARVGFDWSNSQDVLKKIHEELSELEEELISCNSKKAEIEMGDFLFSVVNLSRYLGIDPTIALHKTNQKFTKRFKHVETGINKIGKSLEDSTLKEMDKFWEEAKQYEEN